MNDYSREIAALKRAGRYRERRIFDDDVVDLASNDYLGLAENRVLFEEATARIGREKTHGAKASMLVNGYHRIHKAFEDALCAANGFEAGIVMGSGFNANIAMIEALVRRGDELFIDEKYHASGILAAKLVEGKVTAFAHNDVGDLTAKLEASQARRRIIAVEGIYSMDGDLMAPEIFTAAEAFDAILIVDEAHSSGVVGERLLGVFDLYGIVPGANHIKMGTLGKAYGSFGAYVLSSAAVSDYLINRAKPVIYATAPSLIDTALAHAALNHILHNAAALRRAIDERRRIVNATLGLAMEGLIAPVAVGSNAEALRIQAELLARKVLVGAIRQPTVEHPIVRLIARIGVGTDILEGSCERIAASIK